MYHDCSKTLDEIDGNVVTEADDISFLTKHLLPLRNPRLCILPSELVNLYVGIGYDSQVDTIEEVKRESEWMSDR